MRITVYLDLISNLLILYNIILVLYYIVKYCITARNLLTDLYDKAKTLLLNWVIVGYLLQVVELSHYVFELLLINPEK